MDPARILITSTSNSGTHGDHIAISLDPSGGPTNTANCAESEKKKYEIALELLA